MGDIVDVDPARRDVRRDDDSHAPFAKGRENALAVRLAEVAREGIDLVPVSPEPARDLGGRIAPRGEDERLVRVFVSQDRAEHVDLPVARAGVEELLDPLRNARLLVHAEFLRVEHVALGEGCDLRRHGGREEHRLAAHRDAPDDPVDVVDEPHVEHPVRLVEDEPADPARREVGRADEVEEPSRRADHEVEPGEELLLLPAHRSAPVKHGDPRSERSSDLLRLGADLQRQLARRTDDERLQLALRLEALEDRHEEREGLSRSRLGDPDDVVAGERIGQGHLLNRRRRHVSRLAQDARELRLQVEIVESHVRRLPGTSRISCIPSSTSGRQSPSGNGR